MITAECIGIYSEVCALSGIPNNNNLKKIFNIQSELIGILIMKYRFITLDHKFIK